MSGQHSVKLSFVTASLTDVPFLLALRKQTMTEHLTNAGFILNDNYHLERITESFADSLIIMLKDRQIGLIKLSKQIDKLHIRQLQILPNYQNKGIGGRVMQAVINKAKVLNLPITLNVLLNNPAKKFYLQHGFKVIAENDIEFQMRLLV